MNQEQTEEQKPYEYGPRETPNEGSRLRFGQGKISAHLALLFGFLSILGVLCFRFPEYLTTPELRQLYTEEFARGLLKLGMWLTVGLSLLCLVRNTRKRIAGTALGCVSIAWLMGGYGIRVGSVDDSPVFAGVDWMVLDLLGSAVLFIALEKVLPKYREQVILRPEWRMDLLYFAINHLFVGLFLLISNGFAPLAFGWAVNDSVQQAMQSLPLPVEILVLVLCADFVQYWVHRAFHEVGFLWKFHAVHHCTETMDWLAGSRTHIVQTIVERSLVMVPLYLLGPSLDALNFYVAVAAFQAVFVHANFGARFGFLRYLIVTPQFHHWHHSKDDPAIDTNYAVHTPIYDVIFRSFHLPADHWPKEYGTVSPLPKTFWGQFFYPFKSDDNLALNDATDSQNDPESSGKTS